MPKRNFPGTGQTDIAGLQSRLGRAQRSHDVDLEIDTLLAIAEQAESQGDSGLARLHYEIAARVIRKSNRQMERLCEALGQEAILFRSTDRLERALQLAQDAVEAARKHAGPLAQAGWLGSLGAILREAKSADAAQRAFEESRELFRAQGKAGMAGVADQEGNLGLLARDQGDDATAEAAYRRAAEAAAAAKDFTVVVTWENNLGRALTRRRCYHEAWTHFERAMKAASRLGSDDRLVMVTRNWSGSCGQAHRYADGATVSLNAAKLAHDPRARAVLLEDALRDLRVAEDWTGAADTGKALIDLLLELGNPDERVASLRKAVADDVRRRDRPRTATPKHKPGDATPLDIYVVEAMCHYEEQKNALGQGEMAHLICDISIGLNDPGQSGWRALMHEWGLHYRIVGDAARALIEAEQVEESFAISQRFKSVGFCHPNLERLVRAGSTNPAAEDYLKAWKALKRTVAGLQDATALNIGVRCHAVRAAGEMLREAGEELRERDRTLHARLGGYIRRNDLLDGLPNESPVAIIDFLVGQSGTVSHILFRTRHEVKLLPGFAPNFTTQEVGALLEAWLSHHVAHEISRSQFEGLAQISDVLHDRLFCSLATQMARLHVTQLVLVPDLGLAPLPLHLAGVCSENVKELLSNINVKPLPTDAHMLCEAFPVEYAPCIQAIAATQYQKFPREIKHVVALSDPCSDLPAARATAEWLARASASPAGFTSWSGPDVNRGNLMTGLEHADIAVIGTHGHFNAANPGESYLLLADGRWTQHEMLAEGVLAHGPLVILSACEIGSATVSPDPRQASGIPGALLAGGASAVLAHLWPAEDVSVGVLVERFIHHMSGRGLRPAAALFRAALDLKRMSKQQALERCDGLMDSLARLPSSPARASQMLLVDNLRDWIESCETDHPFESPQFWGGLTVIGNGWHAPAGGSVVRMDDLNGFLQRTIEEFGIREQLGRGEFAEARATIEKLLPTLDGVQRGDALDCLAWAIWNTRLTGAEAAVEHESLKLLLDAEALAKSEQDEQLLRNVAATRAKIAIQKAAHQERHHVKTNHH